jgi:hypothetical protein
VGQVLYIWEKGCTEGFIVVTCLNHSFDVPGTWFIQAVCQQLLCARPKDDVYKLFTSVIREVSSKRAHVEKTYKTMVPTFSTTFTQSLVLPLHPGAKVKVSQRMFERHAFNALLREYIKFRKQKAEQKKVR